MWTWNNDWVGEGEGPLSILAKFQAANAFSPDECCRYLFNRKAKTSTIRGCRSLLNFNWRDSNASDPIANLVVSRSLASLCGRWASWVAADSVTRICVACLDEGALPACLQLSGLRSCPIHGSELIEACSHCKTPNGSYLLDRTPFICKKCSRPFSEKWMAFEHRLCWRPQPTSQALNGAEKWLTSLRSSDLEWPDLYAWQPSPTVLSKSREHGAAVLGTLAQLVPGCPLDVIRTHKVISCAFDACTHRNSPTNLSDRAAIYEDLRRQLRSWSEQHSNEGGHNYPVSFREYLSIDIPASEKYSYIWHAFHIWRSRFELSPLYDALDHINSKVVLHPSGFAWPGLGRVSLEAWINFLTSCWVADLRTALEWHHTILTSRSLPNHEREEYLFNKYLSARTFLCPRIRIWPPSVSLIVDQAASECSRLFLVG